MVKLERALSKPWLQNMMSPNSLNLAQCLFFCYKYLRPPPALISHASSTIGSAFSRERKRVFERERKKVIQRSGAFLAASLYCSFAILFQRVGNVVVRYNRLFDLEK